MSEFPWADYSRWQDPPEIHEDDDCEKCHEIHIFDRMVYRNAIENPQDFPCCVRKLEDMIAMKQICMKHPMAYFEEAEKGKPEYCEGCDLEGVKGAWV